MRYFIQLAYNGKNFHGWQIQNNAITVQQVLNDALSLILRLRIELLGCGRTDTGVHASEYYAHFDLEKPIIESEISKIIYKLNGFLSEDIVIYKIFPVSDTAHARFDAISRTYHYYINTSKDVFNSNFSYYFNARLDIDKMNEASKILFDYSDFSCFSKSNTQTITNNCKIKQAYWEQKDDKIIFVITADRFLRNMVRAIVGTLMEIGTGKMEIKDLHKIIESKSRSEAGYSVPAKGLFLTEIEYPDSIYIV